MRIAMIDPSLFTLPYDQALGVALERAGHAVTLFGRRPLPDDGDPAGVRLVEAFYRIAGSRPVGALPRRLRLGIKGLDHLWSMVRLLPLLRRSRPDVIHFQWLPLPLVDRRMLGSLRRIAPLVLTVHDTNPFNGDPSSRLQMRGLLDSFHGFDRLVVHTEQGRARLLAQGVSPDRLEIAPHGPVRPPEQAADPDPMQGELTFVLFGKIKPYKGADILIEAFAALPERLRAQSRIRIVGKPYMDLAPLHALARAKGVADRVEIEPRFVADAEMPRIFAPGCVAVFPYREIDSSGMLYQALAHGRPVVASRIGGFAEVLTDNAQGLLVPREDPAALTAALGRLVADRGFAADCGRQARALSKQAVGWDDVASRTAAIYAGAAAGRSHATEVSSSTRKTTGGNC